MIARPILAAVILAAGLVLAAVPAWAETTVWRTDFGPLQLTTVNSVVTGRYSDFDGQLFGLMGDERLFVGFWVQPWSEVTCARSVSGSRHWGTVRFDFDGQGRFQGAWTYCDQRDTQPWNGARATLR